MEGVYSMYLLGTSAFQGERLKNEDGGALLGGKNESIY
jgi:hypothetical protein